jgi:hypothetical protein
VIGVSDPLPAGTDADISVDLAFMSDEECRWPMPEQD